MEEFVLCFKDSNLLNLLYGFGKKVLKDCVSLYKYISFKEMIRNLNRKMTLKKELRYQKHCL